jgi:hypothetical protein
MDRVTLVAKVLDGDDRFAFPMRKGYLCTRQRGISMDSKLPIIKDVVQALAIIGNKAKYRFAITDYRNGTVFVDLTPARPQFCSWDVLQEQSSNNSWSLLVTRYGKMSNSDKDNSKCVTCQWTFTVTDDTIPGI